MYILGINAYHGDASATILRDGQLVAAVEEERFNRQKHCAGFPTTAIRYCLEAAGIGPRDLDHVAISRDPQAHLHKKILFTLTRRPNFKTLLLDRLANAAKTRDVRRTLADALGLAPGQLRATFHNIEHHKAHLASAFFVSPFSSAAVCSLDGFGDFVSTMWGVGEGNRLAVQGQVEFPHSLGLLYTAVTQWLGFPKYGDEGKVMGLAPYGEPKHLDLFLGRLIHLEPGGQFRLDTDYFTHAQEGVQMTWEEGSPSMGLVYGPKMLDLFGPPREPRTEMTNHHLDVAASLQRTLEVAIFHVLNHLQQQTGETRLCLAGGVALNSVTNGKIFDETAFAEVFVQPAAGDNGTSLGAAYWVHNQLLGQPRSFVMESAATGPSFTSAQCRAALDERIDELGAMTVERIEDPEELATRLAKQMAAGRVCGWFQGRMEFGPRALGQRSIVVDPRQAEMKDVLNARIKHREAFRPFAPSILAEATAEYFEKDHPSPHMLMVYVTRPEKRAVLGAVNHVDNTGRLQTVDRHVLPRYHALIAAFGRETGVPVVLNTSFNENEPIVCTPQDALNCFLKTGMDVLVMEDWYVARG
ncbi:MAG: carbamoyltransferase [Deltaproteobacteria bacterium]|nr:carbamoyltransferase [Deltaproteobacteria bacterium]